MIRQWTKERSVALFDYVKEYQVVHVVGLVYVDVTFFIFIMNNLWKRPLDNANGIFNDIDDL